MLKLVNIKMNERFIEADYIPEDSSKKAHVRLSISSDEDSFDVVDGFGRNYGRMAVVGLQRTLDELASGVRTELPNERTVMWY